MKHLVLACDYRGIELRDLILQQGRKKGWNIDDIGIRSGDETDYIDISKYLVKTLENANDAIGCIICGSGQGVAMVVNRYSNMRAAVCRNINDVISVREKLNANVLCIGSHQTSVEDALIMLEKFSYTEFKGGKHTTCVGKLLTGVREYNQFIVEALVMDKESILLLEATSLNKYYPAGYLKLPGGHVEYNEYSSQALDRELKDFNIYAHSKSFLTTYENFDNHCEQNHRNIVYVYKIDKFEGQYSSKQKWWNPVRIIRSSLLENEQKIPELKHIIKYL